MGKFVSWQELDSEEVGIMFYCDNCSKDVSSDYDMMHAIIVTPKDLASEGIPVCAECGSKTKYLKLLLMVVDEDSDVKINFK